MEGLYGENSDHKTNSIHELEVSVKEANKHTAVLHQGNMNIPKTNVMWERSSGEVKLREDGDTKTEKAYYYRICL